MIIKYCESKELSSEDKYLIIRAFAIAVDKNDLKMLSVFCDAIRNAENQHNFYFIHTDLLNMALVGNKKEAFEVLSSLVLSEQTQSFMTPLPLRAKINRCWGELIRLQISEEEATQFMYDFMTGLGYHVPSKEDVWQKAYYYKSNAQYADNNCFSYKMYLSAMTNYINVDCKGRGWKTDVELFKIQDEDLNAKIHIPMLHAIENKDFIFIENMLQHLEQNQFLYNQKRRVELFNMHIEWLKAARRYQNLDAFYVLKSIHWLFDGSERYAQCHISKWADECESIEYGSRNVSEVVSDTLSWFSSVLKIINI